MKLINANRLIKDIENSNLEFFEEGKILEFVLKKINQQSMIVNSKDIKNLYCPKCGKKIKFEYESITSDKLNAYCCGIKYYIEIENYQIKTCKDEYYEYENKEE